MGGKLHWSRMFHGNPTSVGRNNIWDNKKKCSPTAHSILKISRALPNSCIASPKRFQICLNQCIIQVENMPCFMIMTSVLQLDILYQCPGTNHDLVAGAAWWLINFFWHISLRVLLSHQLKPITEPTTGNNLRYSFRCVWELHDLTDLKAFYSKHQKGSPTSTRTKRTI